MGDKWGVVEIIITIVTFALGVGAPVMKLNSSITRLTAILENIQAHDEKQDKRLDKHDEMLGNHETRITVLEQKEG